MKVIGLTGGIASGKNTVARMLESRGAAVIDADQLAREVVAPGEPALESIIDTFGAKFINHDGTLDRSALGKLVFADPIARLRLEAITHPAIRRMAYERLASLRRAGAPVVVYMAALIVEANAASRVDEIWVVWVDRETQIKRLMQRDGINREEALQRLAAQMPMEERRRYGKVIIDNSGPLSETERQVREAWEREICV
ncbi:MAG: dephospho-CoA kinase [Geobacteraceae bacterium]